LYFSIYFLSAKILILSLEVIRILIVILLILPVLLVIAFYTLAERKIMGAIQRRRGPNVVGF
jgi:NADH:ubiquinone oxidoreductase subunit H